MRTLFSIHGSLKQSRISGSNSLWVMMVLLFTSSTCNINDCYYKMSMEEKKLTEACSEHNLNWLTVEHVMHTHIHEPPLSYCLEKLVPLENWMPHFLKVHLINWMFHLHKVHHEKLNVPLSLSSSSKKFNVHFLKVHFEKTECPTSLKFIWKI